jgi:hypothetical protein
MFATAFSPGNRPDPERSVFSLAMALLHSQRRTDDLSGVHGSHTIDSEDVVERGLETLHAEGADEIVVQLAGG